MSANTQQPVLDARGKPLKCSMPRHLKSLRLQAAWFHIARMSRYSSFEKENQDKPRDKWKRPLFYGGIATLAAQANCSINTARDLIQGLVKVGALTPLDVVGRSERGKFQTRDYEVALHDDYCRFQACPQFRFQRLHGHTQVVKDGHHKVDPDRVLRFTGQSEADSEVGSACRNPIAVRMQDSGDGPHADF
jgi:hypothetical protein